MDFFAFTHKFPTEKKIIRHFIKIRYGNKVVCPHCGSHHVGQHHNEKFFICHKCNNTFSIFKGTIFEKSTTDLRKWFFVLNMFLNAKKGISACQVQREIGVTYKTAWRILKQIRLAMGNGELKEFIDSVVEMDETYVGGKPRKGSHEVLKRGRGTKKTPVIGAVNRTEKQIYCKVALPNTDGKALSGKQLLAVLEDVCKHSTIVVTDEFKGYNIFKTTNHIHFVVNHSCEYVNGDIHTNNIESFWSTLKRGILGNYHKVSTKYLQSYVNEFCFRYNNRNKDMFNLVLKQAILG